MLVKDFLRFLEEELPGLDAELVKKAFIDKLNSLGIDGVEIEAIVEPDGDTIVKFVDEDGDELTVLFTTDPVEGPVAMVVSEDDEPVVIDLNPLDPPIIDDGYFKYVDLTDLSWMTASTLKTLLAAGDIAEAYVYVVRGGKKIRMPIVRRKKRLTSRQRLALAKARRRAHTASAERARRYSMRIRKRLGLK